jgi:hypothetical protein
MKKSEKRVLIAKDVLAALKAKRFMQNIIDNDGTFIPVQP